MNEHRPKQALADEAKAGEVKEAALMVEGGAREGLPRKVERQHEVERCKREMEGEEVALRWRGGDGGSRGEEVALKEMERQQEAEIAALEVKEAALMVQGGARERLQH